MKVFLDTNVWFSAFYRSKNCHLILKAVSQKKFTLVISRLIIRELTKNINQKFPQGLELIGRYLLVNNPEMIEDSLEISRKYEALADHKDLPILMAAYRGKIKYFVTGNTKDFAIKEIKAKLHIEVITPSKFVELLKI